MEKGRRLLLLGVKYLHRIFFDVSVRTRGIFGENQQWVLVLPIQRLEDSPRMPF
jgi:hypothetical protein